MDESATTQVVVPLAAGDRRYGALNVSTARSVDRAERDLLRDTGAVVAAALVRVSDAPDASALHVFGGALSHELRNHLQSASSRLRLAREDGDVEDHLAEISLALDRIERLADEAEVVADLDLSPADRSTRALAEAADAASRHVDLAELSVERSRPIDAHQPLLELLLENLFRNSVDHAGAAPVRVGATDDGFYVADDGPGVPPEKRDRLFDWGYTTSEDGSGVGLAIVARIADAHGWSVRVTEAETGGARFELTGV